MKRKNILKFVSLLGIGSFVMLAAASCTSTPTPIPNPNPPSGGMNGGNTNPGDGQGMMNAAAQELAAARMGLTTVFDSKDKNLALYVDYKKTQQNLTKAYDAAKTVLDNSSSTTQNLNEAKTRLETAIRTAATSKQTFDEQHAELVKVYEELKTTLSNETATLAPYADAQYAGIKMHLSGLYDAGKAITTKTLEPVEGDLLTADAVMMANTQIVEAIKDEVLNPQKENAKKLADSFVKRIINKTKITGTTKTENQPGNYSFVGYGVDLNTITPRTGDNPQTSSANANLPSWNFAQRIVWTNTGGKNLPLADQTENSVPLTDVSWIYSLSGMNAKYTLTFNYYGPDTAYLYFPYKLVKTNDKAELQYSLNGANAKLIEFNAPTATPVQPPAAPAPAERAATETAATSNQTMPATATMNETPTVADINVAKVKLTGLKFGENTIDFSVSAGEEGMSKVAPMIGNMYLTSSDINANKNKIYDDLFGNTLVKQNNESTVTVDLLKGYSLATSYLEYIRSFTVLTTEGTTTKSPTVYLVGLINGSGPRTDAENVPTTPTSPNLTGNSRTFTIYVNAPQDGDYYISGSYLNGDNTSAQPMRKRYLKFSTTQGTEPNMNSSLVIDVKSLNSWTILGTFDTKTNKNINQETTSTGSAQSANKTLHLKKGLNKVIIGGDNNLDTPYIGNLSFTLKTSTDGSSSTPENVAGAAA
ncbi:hypothetical protein QMY45_03830 [Mycoplasmoides gallisepticum]|uniref:hypothetical protein n=1 Tax=Mycoplasmoides gallisepticum TaxID=2096 RepID=UPI00335D3AAD